MRKGLRFTPARLEKWRDAGRGTGTGADYQPWHQVTRSDPGSRGRSHLINWRFGRLHHLLSDQEMVAFAFASMLPNLVVYGLPQKARKLIDSSGRWIVHAVVYPASIVGSI